MTTDTIPSDRTTTLTRLLDAELAFSPVVQVHYSSHLAMSLVALHRLGADAHRLQRWFDEDRESEQRDDGDALDALRHEITREGIPAVVRSRAPELLHAPGSQLFHPVIRLAYGLGVGHEGQVAAALLDWERRLDPLPVPAPAPGDRRLPDVAAALADASADSWTSTFDLDAVARRPEVVAALEGLAVDEATLDDISSFALAAHIAADSFLTLHLMTGARAIRQVSAWLDADTAHRLTAATAVTMAVGYAAVGAPPLPDAAAMDALRRGDIPSRDEVAARAIADRDPHVVKLADVALSEEERTGDPLHRYVAARVVGLVA